MKELFESQAKASFYSFLESSLQKWKCVLTLPATEKYGQLAWIIRGIFKRGKLHKATPSLFLIWEENTIFHLILANWAGFNDGIHLPLKIRNVFYSLTWCLLLVLSVIAPDSFSPFFNVLFWFFAMNSAESFKIGNHYTLFNNSSGELFNNS